jgi:hypothetical protein
MPLLRAECERGERPCPFDACRHHLPGVEESCSLDVASNGDHTAEEVAALMGLRRETVIAIERIAMRKLRNGEFETVQNRIVATRPVRLCRMCGAECPHLVGAGRPRVFCCDECRLTWGTEQQRLRGKVAP